MKLSGNFRPGDSKSVEGFDGYIRVDSGQYCGSFRINKCGAVLLFATLGKNSDGQVYKLFRRL